MEHRPLAPDLVIPGDSNTCGNKCAGESAPDVASRELRQEKQVGGPVNCSDSELCTFLQALGEGYLPTYYSDTSPSVQSKSMSIASRSYRRGKKTVAFHGFQSLQMSRNLTATPGEVGSMSWPGDSPVRISPAPGRGPESTGNGAAFGLRWPGSFARFDPASSSWKTAQCSLLEGLAEFSGTWPRWGSMLDGECWAQTMPALRTSERGSGYWPTPCRDDHTHSGRDLRNRLIKGSQITLQDAVRLWPTPTAVTDTGGAALCKWGGSGARAKLRTMVTPEELNGSLNPQWVAWLMGWPIEWTSLEPLGTDKFQAWLRWHGRS
jgi:hypothetical protein